jgi:hypothetical protein
MTQTGRPAADSVDRLLDELFDALSGTGAAGRRALAEAEDHLRTAVDAGVATGLSDEEAQREAVRRFGPVSRVAGELRVVHLGVRGLLRRAFTGTWLVGGLSLLAIGVSGLVAEVLGRAFGAGFVAGDPSGVTYTAARCADYAEYHPAATSCAAAAALHHWDEVVTYRVAAGVLGLLALGVLWLARRTVLRGQSWAPPVALTGMVMLALMGVAGVLLSGWSVVSLAFGESSGVGANLAGGVVALVVAVAVAIWAVRRAHRVPRPVQS